MKLNKITIEPSPYRWLFTILVCIAIGWFIIGIKMANNRDIADQAYTDSLTKANLAGDTSKWFIEHSEMPVPAK
jgi:hypothetical protein